MKMRRRDIAGMLIICLALSLTGISRQSVYGDSVTEADYAVSVGAEDDMLAAALPSPWIGTDIGGPSTAGSSSYSAGVYALKSIGTDVWNNSDKLRYVYQPIVGDGEIVARIDALGNSDGWSKAGVMIRETLGANAKHADMVLTPSNGASFQYRKSIGGSSADVTRNALAPQWVKLTRTGNDFKGFISANGSTWTSIGQVNIPMGTSAYIGLALSNPNATKTNEAKFEQVKVMLSGGEDTVAPTAPANVAVTAANERSISLSWTASTDNVGVTRYEVAYNGLVASSTKPG